MKALSEGKLRNVMAFNITPVVDFDEITYHFLDVVHAKLAIEKVIFIVWKDAPIFIDSSFLISLFSMNMTSPKCVLTFCYVAILNYGWANLEGGAEGTSTLLYSMT